MTDQPPSASQPPSSAPPQSPSSAPTPAAPSSTPVPPPAEYPAPTPYHRQAPTTGAKPDAAYPEPTPYTRRVQGWPPPAPKPSAPPPRPGNALATWSLVLGIIGVFMMFTLYAGVMFGALALTFGFIGAAKARKGAKGAGPALAGIVIGALVTLVAILTTVGRLWSY